MEPARLVIFQPRVVIYLIVEPSKRSSDGYHVVQWSHTEYSIRIATEADPREYRETDDDHKGNQRESVRFAQSVLEFGLNSACVGVDDNPFSPASRATSKSDCSYRVGCEFGSDMIHRSGTYRRSTPN